MARKALGLLGQGEPAPRPRSGSPSGQRHRRLLAAARWVLDRLDLLDRQRLGIEPPELLKDADLRGREGVGRMIMAGDCRTGAGRTGVAVQLFSLLSCRGEDATVEAHGLIGS